MMTDASGPVVYALVAGLEVWRVIRIPKVPTVAGARGELAAIDDLGSVESCATPLLIIIISGSAFGASIQNRDWRSWTQVWHYH